MLGREDTGGEVNLMVTRFKLRREQRAIPVLR
jgi:hypothetical protein